MLKPIEAENLGSLPNIRHGFFTRKGGNSGGIYKELNCGFGSNDERDAVTQNRRSIAKHLNPHATKIVTVFQSHSADAIILDAPPNADDLPKADAIVTTKPGLVIGVLTADCTPVLFADPSNGVIAAAHAGWRGAVSGILEATIKNMENAGARRNSIIAAIGPCIHQGSYEVGHEFKNDFLAVDAKNSLFFAQPDNAQKPHFDLPGYVFARLNVLNLADVQLKSPCTYENESLFFSFRRSQHCKEDDYGRQISAIVLD